MEVGIKIIDGRKRERIWTHKSDRGGGGESERPASAIPQRSEKADEMGGSERNETATPEERQILSVFTARGGEIETSDILPTQIDSRRGPRFRRSDSGSRGE